eukprot:9723722-Lingulodinium_polyedra.AAC.1
MPNPRGRTAPRGSGCRCRTVGLPLPATPRGRTTPCGSGNCGPNRIKGRAITVVLVLHLVF